MHLLCCYGMYKPYFCSMKHETFGGLTVQAVADDGCVETIGMGGMDAELVGTPGERIEIDEECTVRSLSTDDVTGDGRFAMLAIHHLSWSVVGIWQKGQINHSF